ncbi:MAG: VOC family protein [Planctomycetota bacterium]
MSSPKPPPITGLSEVVLSVADLPKMRTFYVEVLGFALHSELSMETAEVDPNGEPTITFLQINQTDTPLGNHGHPPLLALIDYRRHVHARKRFTGHDVSRSTLNHLAFEIPPESFDEHVKRFGELKIELTFAEFPDMNARAMFFKDPEGNPLELICHHPNVPESASSSPPDSEKTE